METFTMLSILFGFVLTFSLTYRLISEMESLSKPVSFLGKCLIGIVAGIIIFVISSSIGFQTAENLNLDIHDNKEKDLLQLFMSMVFLGLSPILFYILQVAKHISLYKIQHIINVLAISVSIICGATAYFKLS